MFDTFSPSRDRVLIKRVADQEQTAAGLYKPDTAKQKGQTGEVLAVGPGRLDKDGNCVAVAVRVGDTVYFGKYAGTELDDEYVVLSEDDVLGIVKK